MVWTRRYRWRRRGPAAVAATVGAVAYLVGCALVYASAIRGIENPTVHDVTGGGNVGDLTATLLVSFNAHFVETTVAVPPGGFGEYSTHGVNVVLDAGYSPLLFLFPPVVLAIAGAVTTRVLRIRRPRDAALAGVATALGYLPFVAFAAVIVGTADPLSGDVLLWVDGVLAVLVAGLLYPVVFGGLGGLIAVAVGSAEESPLRTPAE